MSDPRDDRIRRALESGADGFAPSAPLGVTRTGLVSRVRRRQRQAASLLAVAAVVLLVAGASIAAGVGRPSPSSRQVAAKGSPAGGGGGSSAIVTPGSPGGATSSPPSSTGTGLRGGGVASTAAPGVTASTPATTVPPTVAPPTTVPATTLPALGASAVQGEVLFSPTCPVQQFPPAPGCAPRPGPAHIELLAPGGSVAAQGNAGASGQFTIPVAPGSYTVVAATGTGAPSIGRGCMVTPAQVTVSPGARTTVAVSCDTGIR